MFYGARTPSWFIAPFLLNICLIFSSNSNVEAGRRIINSLNFTSSNMRKVKILDFGFDQSGAINMSFEALQPWDRVKVRSRKIDLPDIKIDILIFNSQYNMLMTFKGVGGLGKPRKLARVDDLDWCAAIANTQSVQNPFVRNLMQESKSSRPDFFKKCPLVGVVSMINFQMPQSLVNLLPIGMKTIMYDDIKSGQTKVEMLMNFSLVDD